MKKMLFALNPRPGEEQIRGHLTEILDIFTRASCEIRVHVIRKQGDAAEVTHRYGDRVGLVVCSDGDGTLSETVPGMMKLEKLPLLGYTPAGSTNDFTSSLEIPRRMPQATSDIMEDKPFAVDIGTLYHDRYFMHIVAFGAFMEASYLISQDRESLLGHQAYMIEGVKSLTGLKPYRMEVEWEDQVLEEDFAFGMMTNARGMGSLRGLVNQSVTLDDGLFKVLLIRMSRTPVDSSNIVFYMFLKGEPNEYVYEFKTSSIRMTSEWGVDWVLDDEYGGIRTEINTGSSRERIQILLKK